MSPQGLAAAGHKQFGDTTFTKVFVGGLAWETQKDTMRKYFDQFGEILEAVVITDKNTGRSKGYGFVTFREPEAARRACVDAAPVIDGRRANCNLASFGVQRSRPTTPQHGGMIRNARMSTNKSFSSFSTAGFHGGMRATAATAAFPAASPTTFPHYAIQQGLPYNLYGYSPYSPDYGYPMNYYNMYGGAAGAQYHPVYGGAASGMVTGTTNAFYPYYHHFGQNGGGGSGCNGASDYVQGQSYGALQYPNAFSYSTVGITTGFTPQHYGGPLPLPLSPPAQPGIMTVAPLAGSSPYRLISTHFSPAAAVTPEQPLAN